MSSPYLSFALILLSARLVGRLSQRAGLPAVLGELLAGLILGPSLLGWIQLDEVLHTVADIGVLLLMFIAGLETDLLQMRRVGKASAWAAAAGVVLPFAGGVAVGQWFDLSLPTSLFLGTALTATSVSISVQTFQELGRLRSTEGMVTLGAAIIDDILGILVLSVVLSTTGVGGSVALGLLRLALFFPAALLAGRLLVEPLVRWVHHHHTREAGLALILAVVLVFAWAAEALSGLAAITGAYVAGVLVARIPEARSWVTHSTAVVGYSLFVPVFFVTVGLATNIRDLGVAPWLTLVVVLVAVLTKAVGSGLGARLGGLNGRAAATIGAGMVARGEVALVMATLGLSRGLLDQTTFTVVVLMTMTTTLLTPLLLKFTLRAGPYTGSSSETEEMGKNEQVFAVERPVALPLSQSSV